MSGIACAVLAAGGSRRLGRPKQLVTFRRVPLVRHVADVVRRGPFDASAIVLGANHCAIQEVIADARVHRLVNADWSEGIASSIRVAVAWAAAQRALALVLVLGDQPLLDIEHLERLVNVWRAGDASAVASEYGGILGVPALF